MSAQRDLIVMRTEKCLRVVPGASDDYQCSRCGAQVTVFPSGQQVLREIKPTPALICDGCYDGDYDIGMAAPGALQEAIEARKRE